MTKYVINSGNVRGNAEKAKKYTAEVLEGLGKSPKILFCFFANLREDWETKYQKYTADLVNYLPAGVSPEYTLAMPADFVKQCAECEVVWIHGGDDRLLLYWLEQFDLSKIGDNKVVATSSASSDAVVSSFWTCDWRMCMDGLGLVPIKFIPHFGHFSSRYGDDDPRGPIDWQAAKNELEEYGDKSLPLVAIPEGEFVVYNL